jgi:hypothetical protein
MRALTFPQFCEQRRVVADLRALPEIADSFDTEGEARPGVVYDANGFPLYIEGPDPTQKAHEAYILTIGNAGWFGACPADLEAELYAFYLDECVDADAEEMARLKAATPANRYWGTGGERAAAEQAAGEALAEAPKPLLPATLPFDTVFLLVFGQVVDESPCDYSRLDADDFEDEDADDIRVLFDNALGEAASVFSAFIKANDPEVRGALADIVLARWTDLNDFLTDTTE